LIAREFNSITAENCMKWGLIEPEEGQWQWEAPDRFVDFGTRQGMRIVGHTLVWHSQAPKYLFVDAKGAPVSRETLQKRLESHIGTLVGRYRGRIAIWDVVNEAIDEDEKGWRQTPWLKTLGPSYMERAFQLAHEADPKAHLIYNDYNEHNPGRRKFLVERIRDYKRRGIPLHGVGFQGHIGLDYPDLMEYEKSIEAIAAEGLAIHITELEVDVLPRAWQYTGAEISAIAEGSEKLNPYVDGLPKEVEQQQIARYKEFFELLLKHREKIERVTFWGTHDGESWKNDFPVRGRTNYPLLFDRDLRKKPVYAAVAALGQG
jgi:endo-1,4-beta-xylanase